MSIFFPTIFCALTPCSLFSDPEEEQRVRGGDQRLRLAHLWQQVRAPSQRALGQEVQSERNHRPVRRRHMWPMCGRSMQIISCPLNPHLEKHCSVLLTPKTWWQLGGALLWRRKGLPVMGSAVHTVNLCCVLWVSSSVHSEDKPRDSIRNLSCTWGDHLRRGRLTLLYDTLTSQQATLVPLPVVFIVVVLRWNAHFLIFLDYNISGLCTAASYCWDKKMKCKCVILLFAFVY